MNRGFSEETATIMTSSLSESTIRQYTTSLKLWWTFCDSREVDPFVVCVQSLVQFLQLRYDEGASYSSLNTDRSAISILSPDGFGSKPELSRFFQGIYKLRPPKPRYDSTWDPHQVLEYLKTLYPLAELSLEHTTLKVIGLMALITAHRVQTFASILLEDIKVAAEGIEIFIRAPIKTSGPKRLQPPKR